MDDGEEEVDCPINTRVDCSNLGGFDPSDPCE